ncbi:hypothetical protein [Cystobacter fuscus]|uniref:hypothetical protein n=1 Tax=Cystobacter fuscus TaxID=43 RepID=UPI0012DD3F4B|nr:hypothetical protein [Cystobacter fuscus]
MDKDVLSKVLPHLEIELNKAWKQVIAVQRVQYVRDEEEASSPEGAENLRWEVDVLEHQVRRLFHVLGVSLEAVGLPNARRELIRTRRRLEKGKAGLATTSFLPEVDALESEPIRYANNIVDALRAVSGESRDIETYQLDKLHELLRATAALVRKRNVEPTREADIQKVMNDYLGSYFSDYTSGFSIVGAIKNFEPDGGVPTLSAAIEFKFASTEQEVRTALAGIYEDVAGYGGSKDWTRFYSVIYMTEAFVREEQLRYDLLRGKASSWTPILVTGAGQRRAKKK